MRSAPATIRTSSKKLAYFCKKYSRSATTLVCACQALSEASAIGNITAMYCCIRPHMLDTHMWTYAHIGCDFSPQVCVGHEPSIGFSPSIVSVHWNVCHAICLSKEACFRLRWEHTKALTVISLHVRITTLLEQPRHNCTRLQVSSKVAFAGYKKEIVVPEMHVLWRAYGHGFASVFSQV